MDLVDKPTLKVMKLVIGPTTNGTSLSLMRTKQSEASLLPASSPQGQAARLGQVKRHRGFTLIEILVVMLIISITFGFAMLAFGDFGESRKIRTAAEAFAQFVQLVHDEGLLESSTLQIQLSNTSYSAQRLDTKHLWQPLHPSRNHSPALPSKTRITVAYGSKKPDHLVITMSGSGDMTPFKVYFGSEKQAHLAAVSADENGLVVFHDTDTR
jgi:general secretion pathway protein H